MAEMKLYDEPAVMLILELLSSENAQGFLKGMELAGQLKVEEAIGRLEGIVMCPPPVATGIKEINTSVPMPVLSADGSTGWEYEPIGKTVHVYLPSIVIQEAAIDSIKKIGGEKAQTALKRIRENNKDCRIALKLLGDGMEAGGNRSAKRQIIANQKSNSTKLITFYVFWFAISVAELFCNAVNRWAVYGRT